jgi:hypothetical protein
MNKRSYLIQFLVFFVFVFFTNTFEAQVTACSGTINETNVNTSTGTSATQIGNGVGGPGRIRICLTANNISSSNGCTGPGDLRARVRIYSNAGALLASWFHDTPVGTCITLADCNGYVRVSRGCWVTGGSFTLSYITMDCTTGTVNQCIPAHCNNGILDGNETAADCGGSCPACPDCSLNDVCATATPLSNAVTMSGCNIGATVGPSFPTQPLCDMSTTPTVWYTFTTGADHVAATITLQSNCMTNPNFAIYSGCGTVYLSTCTQGNILSGFTPLAPNTQYWLAVSDADGMECMFDVTVTTYPDTRACLTSATLTSSSSGPYAAGETVQFTFAINVGGWNKSGCNWLQGIVPRFGPCWDETSLTTVSGPTAPGSTNEWSFWADGVVQYNEISGIQYVGGDDVGAGWFYMGAGTGTDPNGRWGYNGGCNEMAGCGNCDNNVSVTFSLTVKDICDLGTDCMVGIKTFADGEVGNWVSPACQADLPMTITRSANPVLCPLPIELLSFEGNYNGSIVELTWKTVSEKDNDYFTIERSSDGVVYQDVGRVKGAGNSTTLLSYKTVDSQPFQGVNYYRLKQTDFDGTFKYSTNISVAVVSMSKTLKVYPNPAASNIGVSFIAPSQGEGTIQIVDHIGKVVYNNQIVLKKGRNETSIDISDWSRGFYTLSVIGTSEIINTNFVKQ